MRGYPGYGNDKPTCVWCAPPPKMAPYKTDFFITPGPLKKHMCCMGNHFSNRLEFLTGSIWTNHTLQIDFCDVPEASKSETNISLEKC